MVDNKNEERLSRPSNVISEETGELDVRFVLWRRFCTETGLAVETLPSELSGEEKAKWEHMKDTELSPQS